MDWWFDRPVVDVFSLEKHNHGGEEGLLQCDSTGSTVFI